MCMGMGGPPYGVDIPRELHEQYSAELKEAWITFDRWWKEASSEGGEISRASMSPEVKEAYELIKTTPIPGYDESVTGADSCYMVFVDSVLVD